MTSSLPLIPVSDVDDDGVLIADSRDMANAFKIKHETFMNTIRRHKEDLELHGEPVCFEFEGAYALLTEDHCFYLATLYPNDSNGREGKAIVVKSFSKARNAVSIS